MFHSIAIATANAQHEYAEARCVPDWWPEFADRRELASVYGWATWLPERWQGYGVALPFGAYQISSTTAAYFEITF